MRGLFFDISVRRCDISMRPSVNSDILMGAFARDNKICAVSGLALVL